MALTSKQEARKQKPPCQVFLLWEFTLIHCTFSKLNWSLNMSTELTGRRLALNLSFLPLFHVMIWLNLNPQLCSHHLITPTGKLYHLGGGSVYHRSKQLPYLVACML